MDNISPNTKKLAIVGGGFALLILFIILIAYLMSGTSATTQPAIQQPIVEQPAIQQPIIQQPTIQQPTIQQPTIQQPTIQQAAPRQIITQADCKQAATSYLQATGRTPVRPMMAGAWGWVTPGCTVQSGGDWTIHWNTNPAAVDRDGIYTTVDASYLV